MNMREKMRGAIILAYDERCTGCRGDYPLGCGCSEKAVDAVLEAMSEPTAKMLLRVGRVENYIEDYAFPPERADHNHIEWWQAMINAARDE